MRNDNELTGTKSIQAFELELLQRQRRMSYLQNNRRSESDILLEPMLKSRSGARVKAESGTAGATSEAVAVLEVVEEPPPGQTSEPVLDVQPDSDALQPAPNATRLAPDAEPESSACPSNRYSILLGRLMDKRWYADLVKSVGDL